MQQQRKQDTEMDCYRITASAFLLHPFILTAITLSSPLSLGQVKQWRRGKNGIDNLKKSWFPLAVSALEQSFHIFIFQLIYKMIFLLSSLPHPQRLAPVVILRLAVGFMQALAGSPRMPSWRWELVRPSVWGSVEMCGR